MICWDAAGRRLITDDNEISHFTWATSNVSSAWGAQATWAPPGADRRGVARRRGSVPTVDRSPEGDAVVSGDTRGDLFMYRWPASSRIGAGHRRYAGHGCAIDAVGFTWDDRFVASIGADGACLIWRHWNAPGENELSEDGSDTEEERGSRRRHMDSMREEPAKSGDGTEDIYSIASSQAKDRAAQMRALPTGVGPLSSPVRVEAFQTVAHPRPVARTHWKKSRRWRGFTGIEAMTAGRTSSSLRRGRRCTQLPQWSSSWA